jgi:hypothetical protein
VNRRETVPAAAAVAAVVVAAVAHAVMSPPPSPALVNACVLAAVAVCAYVSTANLMHNRAVDRQDAAERQAAAERVAKLHQAADVVITGRPDAADGTRPHPADCPSVTPAAVARYAATMGIPGVTLPEAEEALRARLTHRGYAPRHQEGDRS